MLKDSELHGWIKPATQDTGVIIICSGDLPCYLVDTLAARISDWDQVACLYIPYPMQLEHQWLAAEASNPDAHQPTRCVASELLGQIPKTCHLLDVEMLHSVHLTWLGSVCGHRLHFFGLDAAEQAQAVMDIQIEEILDTTGQLVRGYLQDHFLSPA
ncbi:transketolase [Pseudomonas sp. LJDD11]|uniref:transketolase n=1 Tax=Pseudomonas sp. LJDD11 TaxID=2931984 RepID=UPI00211BA897|nr:transketolase [Pseudomonas sp. LJDD11]MCQ9423313.1 transketolase [Pseudomonas sp. LJDD11]